MLSTDILNFVCDRARETCAHANSYDTMSGVAECARAAASRGLAPAGWCPTDSEWDEMVKAWIEAVNNV